MKFSYLFIDLFSAALPFAFSFHGKIQFHKDFKAFFAGNFISALCFIVWDVIFTAKGVWGFNDNFILGVNVYNLPLEEVLFFVCIPFSCVFTYRWLNLIFWQGWDGNGEKWISLFLVLSCLATGVYFWRRAYTATTFISFSILLFLVRFIFKQAWLGKLYRAWLVLILPFFVVNGILTGTGLPAPVVWYNDKETMGIRILSIPVEDIAYGLALVMLTVFFYELFLLFFKATERDAVPTVIQ